MAPLQALDEGTYDTLATQISYCKLFPYILEDFLTRADCKEMMRSSNLPVSTQVNTIVTTSTDAGTGIGKGSGTASPAYAGQEPLAGSLRLKKEKEAIRRAGGVSSKVIGQV